MDLIKKLKPFEVAVNSCHVISVYEKIGLTSRCSGGSGMEMSLELRKSLQQKFTYDLLGDQAT